MELMTILKCCLFVFWFFYSNAYLKLKKVTEAKRMIKLFLPLILVYTILLAAEVYFATVFVGQVLKEEGIKQ